MKKNIIPVVVLLFLLAVSSYYFFFGREGSVVQVRREYFIRDTSRVEAVRIRKGSREVLLDRTSEGWLVDGRYRANQPLMRTFLSVLMRIRKDAPLSKDRHDGVLARFEEEATRVEITLKGGADKEYMVWHDTAMTGHTYLSMPHSDQVYRAALPGMRVENISALYLTEPDAWRDNTLFRLQPGEIESIRVEHRSRPDDSFLISRSDQGSWQLFRSGRPEEAAAPDPEALKTYLYYFTDARFDRIIPADKLPGRDLIATEPVAVITVEPVAGELRTVSFYPGYRMEADGEKRMDMHRLYLKTGESQELLQARYVQVDLLLKDFSYFVTGEKN